LLAALGLNIFRHRRASLASFHFMRGNKRKTAEFFKPLKCRFFGL
jgi:hypothetical protein